MVNHALVRHATRPHALDGFFRTIETRMKTTRSKAISNGISWLRQSPYSHIESDRFPIVLQFAVLGLVSWTIAIFVFYHLLKNPKSRVKQWQRRRARISRTTSLSPRRLRQRKKGEKRTLQRSKSANDDDEVNRGASLRSGKVLTLSPRRSRQTVRSRFPKSTAISNT
uniref:Uncharacterized protein n=1 Tax=Spongospora subterranea TaxID=70186 RepID=A0A0H5QZQ7_9EUKA|eukprot:CRZ07379.1 hypothetical protein [Spongospora subterranea]